MSTKCRRDVTSDHSTTYDPIGFPATDRASFQNILGGQGNFTKLSMWRCCALCREAQYNRSQAGGSHGTGCLGFIYWGLGDEETKTQRPNVDKCVLFYSMEKLQLETNGTTCDVAPHVRSAENDAICNNIWGEELGCRLGTVNSAKQVAHDRAKRYYTTAYRTQGLPLGIHGTQ